MKDSEKEILKQIVAGRYTRISSMFNSSEHSRQS